MFRHLNPAQTVQRIGLSQHCLSAHVAASLMSVCLCESLSHTGEMRAQHLKARHMLDLIRHWKPGLRVSTALLFNRASRPVQANLEPCLRPCPAQRVLPCEHCMN